MSKPVSRVLSCTAIYLSFTLPQSFNAPYSNMPDEQPLAYKLPLGLHRVRFTRRIHLCMPGELLPRLSTLTDMAIGGNFLLHCLGSRLRLTLSATLLCDARTFLTACFDCAAAQLTHLFSLAYLCGFVNITR